MGLLLAGVKAQGQQMLVVVHGGSCARHWEVGGRIGLVPHWQQQAHEVAQGFGPGAVSSYFVAQEA